MENGDFKLFESLQNFVLQIFRIFPVKILDLTHGRLPRHILLKNHGMPRHQILPALESKRVEKCILCNFLDTFLFVKSIMSGVYIVAWGVGAVSNSNVWMMVYI